MKCELANMYIYNVCVQYSIVEELTENLGVTFIIGISQLFIVATLIILTFALPGHSLPLGLQQLQLYLPLSFQAIHQLLARCFFTHTAVLDNY